MGGDTIRSAMRVGYSSANRSDSANRQPEYAFPNDEQELERLDMQHAMMTLLVNNRLFWSPIDPNPQKVLDLGTGTGS